MAVLNFPWTHKNQSHSSIGNLEKTALLCFGKVWVWKNMEYLKMKPGLWRKSCDLEQNVRKRVYFSTTNHHIYALLATASPLAIPFQFLLISILGTDMLEVQGHLQWGKAMAMAISAACFLKDRATVLGIYHHFSSHFSEAAIYTVPGG